MNKKFDFESDSTSTTKGIYLRVFSATHACSLRPAFHDCGETLSVTYLNRDLSIRKNKISAFSLLARFATVSAVAKDLETAHSCDPTNPALKLSVARRASRYNRVRTAKAAFGKRGSLFCTEAAQHGHPECELSCRDAQTTRPPPPENDVMLWLEPPQLQLNACPRLGVDLVCTWCCSRCSRHVVELVVHTLRTILSTLR